MSDSVTLGQNTPIYAAIAAISPSAADRRAEAR